MFVGLKPQAQSRERGGFKCKHGKLERGNIKVEPMSLPLLPSSHSSSAGPFWLMFYGPKSSFFRASAGHLQGQDSILSSSSSLQNVYRVEGQSPFSEASETGH